MKQIYHNLGWLLLIVFSFPSCAQGTYEERMSDLLQETVPVMRANQLQSLMNENESVVLIDARQPEEQKTSHIPGAIFVNYDEFETSYVSSIPQDVKVVVYCTAGYRSERIGEKLLEMGYKDVNNLYGGIIDWKNNGYEVLNDQYQPTDSVHTYNKSWGELLKTGTRVYE